MRVLVVGYGSIGKRHYNNCAALGYDVEVFSAHIKKTKLKSRKYDLIIIASKTSDHLKDVSKFANLSQNFLIEKPLAENAVSGEKIKKILKGKRAIIGYSLIFHPVIGAVKKMLADKKIGRPLLAQIHCGSYLPDWRERDYKKIYSADKKQGGGVHLDLIHEINYAQYLMPEPIEKIFGYKDKISSLKITSDDTALVVLKQKYRYIHISLNYWQRAAERYIKIYGEKGAVYADLINNCVQLIEGSRKLVDKKLKAERNNLFIDELKFAEKCVKQGKMPLKILGIDQAIKDLKIADLI